MTVGHLLFSARGRIGRAQWWVGMIVVGVLYGLGLLVGVYVERSSGFGVGRVVMGLWCALALYLGYCVLAKRFHDRDERPIWALVAVVLAGLQIALDLAEASYPLRMQLINMVNIALLIGRAVLGIVFIVVLGCQRGTVGDNRHGPDPVPSAAPFPAPSKIASR